MNYELIAVWSQVVCFFAFAAVAVWIWQKAVTPAVASAQEAQNQRLAELEARLAKMEAEREEARAAAVRAKEEAKLIVGRVGELVAREREKYLAEIRSEGERELHSAEGELDRARHAARERLREETLAGALAIARERAVAGMDESAERALRERFVSALGGMR
ncbi:MAG: hypothetical protein HKL92_05390 [Candidatus Eremiobacteraeota bacterium]|nr:hypothetical protein [Candidatus Eremiobacteraeota bacterium]NNM92758.1 hypothetical protein [Candidatus Eremiobacteraeota bacterium]